MASTGRALLEVDLPKVKASDDFLDTVRGGRTLSFNTVAVSAAVLLADDMVSLATCVMGADLRGHVLLYQEDDELVPVAVPS